RAQWSKFTGPGNVTFADPTTPFTTATFTAPGIYVLQLTADDSSIQSYDRVEVRVESLCTVEDPQGLAAWWPANGTALDVLNDQAGILASGTAYSTGKVAAAFQLDGTNDFVFVPAQTNYDVGSSTAGFTLEFWTKAVSSASTRGVLSWNNSATGGTSNGVNLYQSSGSLVVRLMDTAGAMRQNASVLGTFDGQWRHVALTYDRTTGTAREYLDGVLKVAENVGIFTPQTSYDFYLGNYARATATFSGQLDEVSLYARPLNPQEVYAIYTSGSVGKCPEDDNQTPWVYAGPDRLVGGTNGSAQLEGEVADDGLPTGSILRAQWSKFTGPGSVTFADPASPFTTATFTAPGIYVLQLTADDSSIQNSDRVEVRVESLCTIEDPQGLVAWWPANGTTLEVLHDQTAILANGTAYSTGKVAAAFQFDGTNDFIFVPAQTNYDVGSSAAGFTLEFWTKAVSSASSRGVLSWNNSATGGTSNGVYA